MDILGYYNFNERHVSPHLYLKIDANTNKSQLFIDILKSIFKRVQFCFGINLYEFLFSVTCIVHID